MASLVTADGSSFELAEGETLVGRGERQVGDPPKVNLGHLPGGLSVSRQHIRLRQEQDEWHLIVERQSTNDTFVDGFALPKGFATPIKDGARLQLGEVVVVFRGQTEPGQDVDDTLDREPVPTPPPPPTSLLVSTAPPVLPQAGPWVARLQSRPAVLEALGVSELSRVNPFEGLMVDAQTWADEQAYHRAAMRLHLLSDHGAGIIQGLEVVISPGAPGTLLVRAGVAIDALGRTLLVSDDTQLTVPDDSGWAYVTLQYADEPTKPQSAWDGDEHATRILERARLTVERQQPEAPALELARFLANGELHDAVNPTTPGTGEVDLRFRERQSLRQPPDLTIAQLATGDEDTHRLGLRFLAREIGQSTPYRVRWAGSVSLDLPIPSAVAMLYLTGHDGFAALTPAQLDYLRAYLAGGGVLFADACHKSDWHAFVTSVNAMASELGVELQPVERWHPLLLSRHVLAAPPLSVQGEHGLIEAGGLILSSSDYGCAWQGGPEDQALGRERIRAALDLGVNVAVFGQQRRRPLDVLDFEA
jgi:Domain of unknown function (DUF4159)/FHA domain